MLVRKINKRRCKVSFCSHSDPSFVLKKNVLSFLHCIPDLWISTPLRTFYILPCDYVSDISDLRPIWLSTLILCRMGFDLAGLVTFMFYDCWTKFICSSKMCFFTFYFYGWGLLL